MTVVIATASAIVDFFRSMTAMRLPDLWTDNITIDNPTLSQIKLAPPLCR